MDLSTVKRIVAALALPESVSGITPLDKGYSSDRKFILQVAGEPRYLLRVSDLAERERREREFAILERLATAGVACSPTLGFGFDVEAGVCYSLLGYLRGECAAEALPGLPKETQYALGRCAGEELLRMHAALPAPEGLDWYAYRVAKYRRTVQAARDEGLTFCRQAEVEAFVEAGRQRINQRPVTFQHDDFHIGNMVVAGRRFVGIIDLNRCDWGDPYHDFVPTAFFTAPVSPVFASGQVDGYFSDHIPADFWPIHTLYVAMAFHGDLVWSQRYSPDELAISRERVAAVLAAQDFVGGGKPRWYRGG